MNRPIMAIIVAIGGAAIILCGLSVFWPRVPLPMAW